MSAQPDDSAYSPQTMQGPLLSGDPQIVRSRIQDWDTDSDTPGPGFAIRAYTLREEPASIPRSLPSVTSSMALTDSTFRNVTPSLSSGSSTASDFSVSSSAASVAVRPGLFNIEGGFLDAFQNSQSEHCRGPSRQPRYISCLFKFLGCEATFQDSRGWYDHSKCHLRGQKPPKSLRCPYSSCPWTISETDGEDAWTRRWAHLCGTHDVLGDGEELVEKHNSQLYAYFWNARLINSAQLQELRASGQLGSDNRPYVATEKSERRRHRQGMPRRRGDGKVPQRW